MDLNENQNQLLTELDRSFPGRPLNRGEITDIVNFIKERKELASVSSSSSVDLLPLKPIVEDGLERLLGFPPDPEIVAIFEKAMNGIAEAKGKILGARNETRLLVSRLPDTPGALAVFRYLVGDNGSRREFAERHQMDESTLRKAEQRFLRFLGFSLPK